MIGKFDVLRRASATTPMAGVSWGPSDARSAKDVAEGWALGNSLLVAEAYAGMMVTPSVKLVRPLGEGGMGAVWVADHLALHTQVVVKFIAAGLRDSKDATERFSREAAAAAQVKSPHVVQTFDHGVTSEGIPYIVMELLEGRDLGQFIEEQGKCPPDVVVEIVTQLGRALDRAHERGIVHRDIKPGNIFLCDGGRGEVFVKLLDFGIAKGVEIPHLNSETKTGSMIGSPFYMSPEQILGSRNIDRRSDLWSVGVVAYEMLTGTKPFDAETMGGLAIRIHSEPLPLPSHRVPSLSPAVDVWFQRACARKADERFSTCKEMADALTLALGGVVPPSRDGALVSSRTPSDPHAPTLVAGATTEAGVVRSTPVAKTRNRVVALMTFGLVVAIGSAFIVKAALRKDDASPRASTATAEPSPAEKNAPPPALSAPSPPVSASAVAAPVASVAPPPPVNASSPRVERSLSKRGTSIKTGTPVAAPAVPPLPSAAPSAPAQAKPGHDIF